MIKCETCDKDYEGRGKVCDACRKQKSRLRNPVTQTDYSLKEGKLNEVKNSCGCVETEHAKNCIRCMREGKRCDNKYYDCPKHNYHISSYCVTMCV